MIRCKAIEQFTLKDFDKLSNIKRKSIEEKGKLFVGDEFDCDEKMASYLTGDNEKKKVVVKVIEVEPKMPTIIGHRADDVEYVVPLDNENMKKISKAIEKSINENGLTVEGLGINKEFKPKKENK